jgi:hypothetical protein
MRKQLEFTFIAAAMVMEIVSPALAQSFSFPTYAYLHPQTVRHDYRAAYPRRLYNYLPTQGGQAAWPSAAAMGNSH